MTKSRGRTTGKQSRAAREWNRRNHTHFKQLNKRPIGYGTPHSRSQDMRRGTPPNDYEMFHTMKRARLVSLIKTSVTIREFWNQIKDNPAQRSIVQGMNGVESTNPLQYLRSIMQRCVRDGTLVCVYERELNTNSAKGSINHRWRYIRKSNLPMITYYIIKNYRHTICEKCIKTIKKIKKIVSNPPFINRL